MPRGTAAALSVASGRSVTSGPTGAAGVPAALPAVDCANQADLVARRSRPVPQPRGAKRGDASVLGIGATMNRANGGTEPNGREVDVIDIEREFHSVIQALEGAGLEYAVIGAFAVAIWGAPRATTDIDLMVQPEDVDEVLSLARGLGFAFEAFPMKFRDGAELRRLTRVQGEELLTLDLLLVDANLRPAWESRMTVATEVGPVKVVSRDALLSMKAAAGRPQDVGDIQRLAELDR